MSAKSQASKPSDKTESLPQTSDDSFKKSGFGGFTNSAASPFGNFTSSKPSTSSVFGAATGGKLSTFAGSPAAPTTTGGGFGGTFGGSSKSGFGGSPFGGSSGNGFRGFSGSTTGGSFATSGSLEIKGLKSTNKDTPFGAAKVNEESEEEDGGEDDPEGETEKEERQTSQPLLSQQRKSITCILHCGTDHPEHETGEEGEDTIWTGRAKLYTMAGEGTHRQWKERGVGTFKFNVTAEQPKRARFVLRAEGTHRLLLNARVTREMTFGEDAQGERPKDMRLLFNSPNAGGEVEMHLLKVCYVLTSLLGYSGIGLLTLWTTVETRECCQALGGSHQGAGGTAVGRFFSEQPC
jgi:Ran-binding protein 3